MSQPKPRFTGLFIPVEVLDIEGLSHTDQMLLAWIDALYCKDHDGCFASNDYFAKRLKVVPMTVSKSISKLIKLKLIQSKNPSGKLRILNVSKSKWPHNRLSEGGYPKKDRGVSEKGYPTSSGKRQAEKQPEIKQREKKYSAVESSTVELTQEQHKASQWLAGKGFPKRLAEAIASEYTTEQIRKASAYVKKRHEKGIDIGDYVAYLLSSLHHPEWYSS